MTRIVDYIKRMFPLSQENNLALGQFKELLNLAELKTLKASLKDGKLRISSAKLGLNFIGDRSFPTVDISAHDKETMEAAETINGKSERHAKEGVFKEITKNITINSRKFIASGIVGLEAAKDAAFLQLCSKEQINILMIGDPGTGKTEILRSCQEIAPIAEFGLGSGMSGVGLTVTVQGKAVQKGILPLADKGMALIDELNLMKKVDVGGLYNAMEKGFVTYDKAGKHYRFDARVSVLATANPRYSNFLGKSAEQLRKEIPFDAALLTRFHLVFFIRKPDINKFVEIAKGILKQQISINEHDKKLMKEYIQKARQIDVELPKEFEAQVVEFAKQLKKDEKKFLVEVNPRLVVGIVRLAKAKAASQLKNKVEAADLEIVKELVQSSLYFSQESKQTM
ncbi:MAG: ATP-binding protein [Candidatus Woesearchaeota archaeon]